jgi:hypothetical protein
VALREALIPAYGGHVDDQVQNHFDEAGQVRLRPDIVWKIRGSAIAVIDAIFLISQMRDLAQTIAAACLTALVSPTVFQGA